MKPLHKNIIQYSILAIIVVFFIHYIINHLEDFKQLALINPLWLIPVLILFLFNYYFIGVQTAVLIEPLGVNLKKIEAFMLSIITGFYNIITPAHGGMAIRAVYLKQKYKFPYTHFLSSLAGMFVLVFFIGGIIGLVTSYFIYVTLGFYNFLIILAFFGLFVITGCIILFSPSFKETKYGFINKILKVANGWNTIKKNNNVLFICGFMTVLHLLSNAIILIILYYSVGIKITILASLFLAAINSITIIILLTPGNLGVQEAIAVFSATVIGITPAEALVVAILMRIVQMISLFTLGPIFSYKLMKGK